jgi:glycerophosphoryl diester phosphodiesterase
LQQHEYFNVNTPVVLAHRGGSTHTENTLEAFHDSAKAGVFSIETDVRTTRDQVAILFHDADLIRVAGIDKKISETDYSVIKEVELRGGGRIPTLLEALQALPFMRFNLDIKDEHSVETASAAIELTKSHHRVLVSSFSERRRVAALARMSKPVATSASASVVISVWLMHVFHLPQRFIQKKLENIGALQIPRSMYGIKLDSRSFIAKIRNSATHVHYWTINNPQDILELTKRGATGIVSDVPELAVQTLRKP